MCVCVCVCVCVLRHLCTRKKTRKRVERKVFCVKLIAVRGPVSFEHVGTIMHSEIIKMAARATKSSRIFAIRSGGWCRSYHVGGEAWKEAVAKATAMVEGREVVTRKGHAGYVEGFRPDGSEFNRGGVGPL